MKIELHLLQNFAPACLNRDDTNAPKECEFGGARRARISSQCLKRAVRMVFAGRHLLDDDERALRTKRVTARLAEKLATALREKGTAADESQASAAARFVISGLGFKIDEEEKTQYLLFLSEAALGALATAMAERWDLVRKSLPETPAGDDAAKAKKAGKQEQRREGKKSKQDAREAFPDELKKAFEPIFADAQRSPEIALFGRMIADKVEWNVEAACQVAHALSTNRVSMEFDFYTAVDDLRREDTAGADMMGTVQFNSACFYRYSVVDLDKLAENLGGARSAEAVRRALGSYLEASIAAIPSGRQNNTAAHNPPGLVLAVVRGAGEPISLANAFLDPIRSKPAAISGDLLSQSAIALDRHLGQIVRMYGRNGLHRVLWCALDEALGAHLPHLSGGAGSQLAGLVERKDTVADLIESVLGASGVPAAATEAA